MPNGIAQSYQLDQSISVLRVAGGIFRLYSYFDRKYVSKQWRETLIRRGVLRRLIWVCTVCLCPIKRAYDLHSHGFSHTH